MKAYRHKSNRYARGVLFDNMTFRSEKVKRFGNTEQLEYIFKTVNEDFFNHFIEIPHLELTVIEFEESKGVK